MTYEDFIASKAIRHVPSGLSDVPELGEYLFPFQRDVVGWALRRGRAAIFADCGMGKTVMQLEWARHVPGRVLILAPLAVARQTVAEAERFGIACEYARADGESDAPIVVTNYEMAEHFDPAGFAGVVLDESSILKSYDGSTRTMLTERFSETAFRLACTATPAPNDHSELGTHSEFLGVMPRVEMLATFFVHDGGSTQDWRVKGHAEDAFWRWVASWAVVLRSPADLGYDDGGFVLPPLVITQHVVSAPRTTAGTLFEMDAQTLQERQAARRDSIADRVAKCAEMVNASDEPWVIWCNLNAESDALVAAIPGAVDVHGSQDMETKVDRLMGFTEGRYRVIVTKPRIAGFGMNWQHCHNVAFVGLSDSWEQYYQAVRRCWRFGQTKPVMVRVVTAENEGAVVLNIKRKDAAAKVLMASVAEHMKSEMDREVRGVTKTGDNYERDIATGDGWTLHLGDCVEVMREMPSDSVHFSVFSPPFASLYTYTAQDRDMGNCRDSDEFAKQFRFAVDELYRVIMPGRLVSFHCMNLPTSKVRNGYIGLEDFRGNLIRMFQEAGFIFHSEVVIWKDPVTAMQRTKALGLLHKQLVKDSAMSRQGIPDYLVTMRKPGDNPEKVAGELDEYVGTDDEKAIREGGRLSINIWQRYASPVWMDINPSRTLQKESARDEKDERHVCPLQLDVIERAIQLWTNEGDTVLSPFAGIGSEGFVAIEKGRKFIGAELKRSYWEQARKNLANAAPRQGRLFGAA
jgi:DNA modification methylase